MSQPVSITYICVSGLYGHQELELRLLPGLNLVHGKNGSGKTTILHMLANILEGDLQRFHYIRFQNIFLRTSDNHTIRVIQTGHPDGQSIYLEIDDRQITETKRDDPPSEQAVAALESLFERQPVYLPAFRSILEAASERMLRRSQTYDSPRAEQEMEHLKTREFQRLQRIEEIPGYADAQSEDIALKTSLCRRWFGAFVPVIRYPSIANVNSFLRAEIDRAYYRAYLSTQDTFSTVFTEVLLALLQPHAPNITEPASVLLAQVRQSLNKLGPSESPADRYNELAKIIDDRQGTFPNTEDIYTNVLAIYDSALRKRAEVEENATKQLRIYQQSVNRFLSPKSLVIDYSQIGERTRQGNLIRLANGQRAPLRVLSSGERQVLTMLFLRHAHVTRRWRYAD